MTENKLPAGKNLHLLCMLWAEQGLIYRQDNKIFFKLLRIDPKILYMTARPVKLRNFVEANKFLAIWQNNPAHFQQEPPEIGLIYTSMPPDNHGIAHAISIVLTNPILNTDGSWSFELNSSNQELAAGVYHDIILFIDWLPTNYCPKPIHDLFPTLLTGKI